MSETNGHKKTQPSAAATLKPEPPEYSSKFSLVVLLLGVLIRVYLINSDSLKGSLQNRVEIATPLTSWSRVLEGIYLKNTIGLSSSYEGDLVHEIPVMLRIYQLLLAACGNLLVSYVFVLVDVLGAVLLHSFAFKVIKHLHHVEAANLKAGKYARLVDEKRTTPSAVNLDTFLVNEKTLDPHFWSLFTMAAFFLNPFSVASCAAQSTVTIHNLILLLWLYFLVQGNRSLLSYLFLALHAHISVYTVVLIIPSISFVIQKLEYFSASNNNSSSIRKLTVQDYVSTALKHLLLFGALLASIFGANWVLEDYNLRFIECTYYFVLKVPDLIPNLGLFWYFFTEMFEHFRLFFTCVFQINVFIFTIPLAVRLKNDPVVNLFIQLGLIACLKSYPSIGDTGFCLSLLPILAYLFPLMRNFIVYTGMLVVSSILAPIMFYLWLGGGGGNANFYFAITLVYSIGQIFLLVDIFYANLKREFIKTNGPYVPKNKSGAMAVFSLE